jgi:positive regulator of sigma E activity
MICICLTNIVRPSVRQVISMAADRARVSIDKRVAGDQDVVVELQQQSTLIGLVLLALKTPATFLLPPWLFAYTFRTALNIVDLLVNKYKPKLPQLVDYAIKQVERRWMSVVQLAAAPSYRHKQTRPFGDDCVDMCLVQRMRCIAWHV